MSACKVLSELYTALIILIKSPASLCGCHSPASVVKREHGVSRSSSLIAACRACLRKRQEMKIRSALSCPLFAFSSSLLGKWSVIFTARHVLLVQKIDLCLLSPSWYVRMRWCHRAAKKKHYFWVFKPSTLNIYYILIKIL